MDITEFILTLPLIVVGLAAATSLISFRYHYPPILKKLAVLWVINFCFDLMGHIIVYYNGETLWLYNIYFWIQYMALTWLYDQQMDNKFVHTWARAFYIIFPIIVAVETIFSGIRNLQTFVIVSGGIFMIFLAASYFRQLYVSEETETINRDPWFWFSFGFIIHFGCTTPFLGMLNYLVQEYPEFAHIYYLYVSNTFTILLNILIIVGFLCRRNYQKSR